MRKLTGLDEMDLILYVLVNIIQKTGQSKSCSYLTMFDMKMLSASIFLNNESCLQRSSKIHHALNNFVKVSNNDILYDSELGRSVI